jgi:hypothetical protein
VLTILYIYYGSREVKRFGECMGTNARLYIYVLCQLIVYRNNWKASKRVISHRSCIKRIGRS